MTMNQTDIDAFYAGLKAVQARLRVYALSLTRDRDRADDLVQQTSLKALAGRESFRPGTNFAAWIFRNGRNEFISELRRGQRTVDIADADADATLSTPPTQESGLIMRELAAAVRRLPGGQRQALVRSALEGQSYRQSARQTGVAGGGPLKSRVCRGRATLKRLLASKPVGARRTPARSLTTGDQGAGA